MVISRLRTLAWLALVVAGCEAGPDFSKPGDDGPDFGDKVLTTLERQWIVADPLPATLECGKTYALVASAVDSQADCKGYDYGYLYGVAHETLHSRGLDAECPEACEFKQARITGESGSCLEGRARVEAAAALTCATDPALVPYEPLGAAALKQPFRRDFEPSGVPNNEQLEFTLLPQDQALASCPRNHVFGVERIDAGISCDDVTDYTPYVDQVKLQLHRHYDRLTCPSPCRKKPINPAQDELYIWDCMLMTVKVQGYIEAQCLQPQ